ncbi:MAG: hypothetical protein COA33_011935 [Fluviicola sp.]|nr:hypothetical protein [Fluviicola sp.]
MKTLILYIATAFITLSFTLSPNLPKGWFKAGSKPVNYDMGTDSKVFKTGTSSAFIASTAKKIKGFGTLMQTCSAKNYLGKKIKLTGFIKSENVEKWSGMWLRIDQPSTNVALGFDNMQNRPIQGTTDWKQYEIVLSVPENASTLNFGVLLSGTGKVWFDNMKIEIVGIAESNTSNHNLLEQPNNLDFEE